MRKFNTVLVANRAAVASRVIRALRKPGIRSVAVYSDADREVAYVAEADQSIAIGGAPPRESYLCAERLIDAAKACRADALHPGYGFLAENASFAQRDIDSGVAFITSHCDSLIAKVIAYASTREQAMSLLDSALGQFEISGLKTNIPAVQLVLQSEAFREGNVHTGLIQECVEGPKSRRAAA